MGKFVYTAKDSTGHTLKGELLAADKKKALDILREKGLLVLNLEAFKEKSAMFSFLSLTSKKKIAMEELVIFSRQMATMTGAGITIVDSLDTLADQVDNPSLQKILKDIRDSVNTGASLSEAMSKYTVVFSAYFVNMIKAGESSGMLDEVLERISSYMEKTNALQKKIKTAMVYPSIVSLMAVGITLVMILKVIPVFKDMFSGFGAALPAPTMFLINLSDAMRHYFVFFVVGFVIFGVIVKRYTRTEKGQTVIDGLKLKMPVFGELFKRVAISKFTRTLSTLMKSGVPILTALEIVAKTAGNRVVEKSINTVRDSVREGESISSPMAKSGIFPPLVTRMVAVGEKSGELETMLIKIADFYDEQVDAIVDGLTSLIEPLIIAFLGIVIGGIVISMFLPIFQISSLVNM
ncbi:MAG: type II secretion system F family protein [Candidatus Omnitrophota bacterium]